MNRFLCVLLLLFIVACVNKDKPPSGILLPDSMRNVMWDMIQADQYAKQFLEKDTSRVRVKDSSIKIYQGVLDLHHITQEEFRKSYRYYLTRPDLNKIIYDSLSAQITRQRHEQTFPTQKKPMVQIAK
jgi:hypothetical protein